MTIGPRMTLLIAVLAVVVCALQVMAKRATDITPTGRLVVALFAPFDNEAGMAWRVMHILPFDKDALRSYPADDPTNAYDVRSPVLIYEDDKPLGPAHSNFAEISKIGHGHFNHWTDQGFIFSTSDGSDPNRNGRRYWAVVR